MSSPSSAPSVGRLVLAATPLGQAADASARLVAALATADVVAAEDTRRLRALAAALGVTVARAGRVSHYDANEAARLPGLLDAVRAGATVLVVTDAGMPSVSDPGYRLVPRRSPRGCRSPACPGPSAVTTALALSGLPSRPVLLRGLPAAAAGGAAALARAARRRARGRWSSSSRRTGSPTRSPTPPRCSARTGRRGLPGADEDVRGGRPAAARRARGLGGRGRCAARSRVVLGGAPSAAPPSVAVARRRGAERVAAGSG